MALCYVLPEGILSSERHWCLQKLMADLSLFWSRHNLSARPPLQRIKEWSALPGISIWFAKWQATGQMYMYIYVCIFWPLETESSSKTMFCRLVLTILSFPMELLPTKHTPRVNTCNKTFSVSGCSKSSCFQSCLQYEECKKRFLTFPCTMNRSY